MNPGYLLYQAERPVPAAEQRQADTRNAELYAALSGLLHSLKGSLRGARRRAGTPAAPAASLCGQ